VVELVRAKDLLAAEVKVAVAREIAVKAIEVKETEAIVAKEIVEIAVIHTTITMVMVETGVDGEHGAVMDYS
jgi:hypothetical protein